MDQYELRLYSDFSSTDEVDEEDAAVPSTQVKRPSTRLRPSLSPKPQDSDSESPIPSGRNQRLRRLQSKETSKREVKQPLEALPAVASGSGVQIVGSKRKRRSPTMWDALAGSLNHQDFIPDSPFYASRRDRASSSMEPVNFRYWMMEGAPSLISYADILGRHCKDLKVQAAKPDHDLMRALHVYISEFYARMPGGDSSFQSMWPGALTAFAVLLEETMAGKMEGNAWKAILERRKGSSEHGIPVNGFFDWQTSQWLPSVLDEEERRNSDEESRVTPDKVAKFTRRTEGRRRVRCDACFKAKKKCDLGHPCSRCMALGRAGHCHYETESQSDTSSRSRSRSRVILSCYRCYKAKRACDHQQPCGRCLRTGHADLCVYEGGSVRKMELSDQVGRYRSAAQVKSERGSRVASVGLVAEDEMDEEESQEDDSETDHESEESLADENTGSVPYGNPDSRPAAKKAGLDGMPQWLRRAIGSQSGDEEADEEEEDDEDDDDDIDPDDLEAQERRFVRGLR